MKPGNQLGNSKLCISMSHIKAVLKSLIPFLYLWTATTSLTWAGSTPCEQLSTIHSFQYLGSTHKLRCFYKGLASLHQLCSLQHSRLWLTPLYHSCCSWCIPHDTGLSSMLGSSAEIRLQQQPLMVFLYGMKPQFLCVTPTVLGHQLQLRLNRWQWSSLDSHSVKTQLPSMTPSYFLNQNHLWFIHISKNSYNRKYNLGSLKHNFFVLTKNISQKILPQTCWCLLKPLLIFQVQPTSINSLCKSFNSLL